MTGFKSYHPLINFIYFVFVIGFSMFLMHPVCLLISLLCALFHAMHLKGMSAMKKSLLYMLPVFLLTALINPMFNHEGATIIAYLPSGNPMTAESIVYGLASGMMLVSVLLWFLCFNEVMTSDKYMFLFGKIMPALSLVLSMTIGFVPKFMAQLKLVSNAQTCMGLGLSNKGIISRAKNGMRIISVMVTWSLENAIETADSMKSSGYGMSCRTSFSIYKFEKRDKKMFAVILLLGSYTLWGAVSGGVSFRFFPALEFASMSVYRVGIFLSYLCVCICPAVVEFWEVKKWEVLRSKI